MKSHLNYVSSWIIQSVFSWTKPNRYRERYRDRQTHREGKPLRTFWVQAGRTRLNETVLSITPSPLEPNLLGREGGGKKCYRVYLSSEDRSRLTYRMYLHTAYVGSYGRRMKFPNQLLVSTWMHKVDPLPARLALMELWHWFQVVQGDVDQDLLPHELFSIPTGHSVLRLFTWQCYPFDRRCHLPGKGILQHWPAATRNSLWGDVILQFETAI